MKTKDQNVETLILETFKLREISVFQKP